MLRNYYKPMFTSKIIQVIILTWLIRQHLLMATAATGATSHILLSYQPHNINSSNSNSNSSNSTVENLVLNTKPLISTHDQKVKAGKSVVNSSNNTLANGHTSQSKASVKSSTNSLNVNNTDTEMTLKLKDATARNVYITQPAPVPTTAAQFNNGNGKTVISFSSTSSVQSNYKITAANTMSMTNTTAAFAVGQLASSEIISSPETVRNNETEKAGKYQHNPRSPYQITTAALNISLLMNTAAKYQNQNQSQNQNNSNSNSNSNSEIMHTNQAFDNSEKGRSMDLINTPATSANGNLISTPQDLKAIKSESITNDDVVSETGQLKESQQKIFLRFLKDLNKNHRAERERMENNTKQDDKMAKRKHNTNNPLMPYQDINMKVQGLQKLDRKTEAQNFNLTIDGKKKKKNLLAKQTQHKDRNGNENEKQNEKGKQLSLITNLKSYTERKTNNFVNESRLLKAQSDATALNEPENWEKFLKNSSKTKGNEKLLVFTKQNESQHAKASNNKSLSDTQIFKVKSIKLKTSVTDENPNTQRLNAALQLEPLKRLDPKSLKISEDFREFKPEVRKLNKILNTSNSSTSRASNIEPLSSGGSNASWSINSNETKSWISKSYNNKPKLFDLKNSSETKALEHNNHDISKAFTLQSLNETKAFNNTDIIKKTNFSSSNESVKNTEKLALQTVFQKELELEMKLDRLKQVETKMYKKLKKEMNTIRAALQNKKVIQTKLDKQLGNVAQDQNILNKNIGATELNNELFKANGMILENLNLKNNKSQATAGLWQREKRLNIKSSNPDGLTNLTFNKAIPALQENFANIPRNFTLHSDKQSITETTTKSIENENEKTSERVDLETADVHKLKYFHDDADDADDVKQKQTPIKNNKTTTDAVQSLLAIDANMNNKQLARPDSNSDGGNVNNPEQQQIENTTKRNQTKLLITEKYNDTGMNDNIETTTTNTETYLSTSSADRVSVTDELRQDLWEFLTTLATADSLATTTAAIDLIRPTTPLFISDNLANKSTTFIYNNTTTTTPYTTRRPLTLTDLVNATLNPTTTATTREISEETLTTTFSSTDLMQLIATATATSQSVSATVQPTLLTLTPLVNASATNTAITGFSTISTTTTPSWPVKHASVMEGNVILGGLMMVHSREDSITCGPIMPQGGIQALEAMLYTLDQVNKLQLLPNITLGAHILDDCDKDTYGLEMAVDFIKAGQC